MNATFAVRSGIAFLILFSGCKMAQDRPTLTYPARQQEFVITTRAQGTLEAQKAQPIATPGIIQTMPQIDWLIPEGSWVKKGELVAVLGASAIETQYRTSRDELEIARAEAEQGKANLQMEKMQLQSELNQTQAKLKAAKLQLEKVPFESEKNQEIRKLEIAKEELESGRLDDKLTSLAKIQEEELARLNLKINQAKGTFEQSKRILEQLQLTTPSDGFVQYERSWFTGEKVEVGGQAYMGMPIVKIPDLSSMQVKMLVSETDAQKLAKGLPANIRLPSLQDQQLAGKVANVDRMAKPVRRGSKVKRVEITVEVDSTDAELVPGLSAECVITIEKIDSAMVIPKECVIDLDAMKVVFVRNAAGFIPHEIKVEKYADDFVAVRGGIVDGAQCALAEPKESAVDWGRLQRLGDTPVKTDSRLHTSSHSQYDTTGLTYKENGN